MEGGAQKKNLPPGSATQPPREAGLSPWLVALLLTQLPFCLDSAYPPGLGWRMGWVLWEGAAGREAPLTALLKEDSKSWLSEGRDFDASVDNWSPSHPVWG